MLPYLYLKILNIIIYKILKILVFIDVKIINKILFYLNINLN